MSTEPPHDVQIVHLVTAGHVGTSSKGIGQAHAENLRGSVF